MQLIVLKGPRESKHTYHTEFHDKEGNMVVRSQKPRV